MAAKLLFEFVILPNVRTELENREKLTPLTINFRIFEILNCHALLYPQSKSRDVFYVLLACSFAAVCLGFVLTILSLPVQHN